MGPRQFYRLEPGARRLGKTGRGQPGDRDITYGERWRCNALISTEQGPIDRQPVDRLHKDYSGQ